MLTRHAPLIWRVLAVIALLVAEMLLRKALLPELADEVDYFPLQSQLYSLPVAWAGALAILMAAGGSGQTSDAAMQLSGRRPNVVWLALHLLLIVPVIWPGLLGAGVSLEFMQVLQHVLVAGAVLALLLALIPVQTWRGLLSGSLPLAALVLAVAAVLAFQVAQDLWQYAAGLTFRIVQAMLSPFYPDLRTDPQAFTVGVDSIEVSISEVCSGLEGVGMMLVFGAGWLWYLRREFRFPRALLLLPVAALLVFLLNAVRIALLFALAAHGQYEIARAGFHSQAGWIFFNVAAFLVALASRRISWIRRPDQAVLPQRPDTESDSMVAAFLLPLLALLATGMLTRAMSAGFDQLYWLRLPVALAVLLMYRRAYTQLDWRFSWRGVAAGVIVFAAWLLAAQWLSDPSAMPTTLAEMPALERDWWIVNRILVTALVVPVAEELAFRGFLMRRLVNADFSSIQMSQVHLRAVAISSVLFGLSHGGYWLPGIFAGLLFGLVAVRTNRFGEAVAAHAVANALLAATVLTSGRWELW